MFVKKRLRKFRVGLAVKHGARDAESPSLCYLGGETKLRRDQSVSETREKEERVTKAFWRLSTIFAGDEEGVIQIYESSQAVADQPLDHKRSSQHSSQIPSKQEIRTERLSRPGLLQRLLQEIRSNNW